MSTKLLYVYEERIPLALQELVLSYIPRDEFEVEKMLYTESDADKIQKLTWAEVVLFAPGRHLSDEVLAHAGHIKLMQLWSSGYDKFNVAGCTKYGIPVANNGGANACSVAEHALLLMLSVYKWLPDSHRRTVTGQWAGNSHGLDMFLLNGKKVGIVGFGNIGRQVAKKLRGFEAEVFYYDVTRADKEVEAEHEVQYASFETIIAQSDILTLHLHANDTTAGIISKDVLANMKKSAVLINVSRAQLIDQEALYEALHSRSIAGAGLDVYTKEPTVANDPLLLLPNVVATPHIAGSTYDTYSMVMNRAIKNFRRVVAGEKAQWLINDTDNREPT